MPLSQNGWSASPDLSLAPLTVGGVSFIPGIRNDDDVVAVLGYVMEQYHRRVEPLRNPGCWGFNYRGNRNDPDSLSNHSSGTAVDANAPAHPNGVPASRTFTRQQIAEIHKILYEVDYTVRWGGDYRGTPDAMHFEIDVSPGGLRAVAARLREKENDMDAKQYNEMKNLMLETKAAALDAAKEAERARRGSYQRDTRLVKNLAKRFEISEDRVLAALAELDDE